MHCYIIWTYSELRRIFGTADNYFEKECLEKDYLETILNCRDIDENNVPKACFLTVFKKVFDLQRKNTSMVKCALWRYLKQFVTAEKKIKNNVPKSCILMEVWGAWVGKHSPGNVKIRTVIVVFWRYLKRYFGTAEKMLKTRTRNGAFRRYLVW